MSGIDVRMSVALADLVVAIEDYREFIYYDGDADPRLLEQVQLAVAKAFLRASDLPASRGELFEPATSAVQPLDVDRLAYEYRKGHIPPDLRWAVFRRDGFRCKECGLQAHLHADHIVPESKGGPTTLDNLQTLCRDCNRRKGVSMPESRG